MAKKVLGKGLAALIPLAKKEEKLYEADLTSPLAELPVSKIKRNQYQPRTEFNKEHLEELMLSIKEKGVLQPIMVRTLKNGHYELIAGERRLRSVKELGLKTIPAIIKTADDEEMLELALIENIQRENLNPMEEAKAYQKLADDFKLTQEKIAQKLGKTRTVITNTLRLLKLPLEIQEYLSNEQISMGHARAILSIEDKYTQIEAGKKIIQENLSVREIENLVKKIGRKQPKATPKQKVNGFESQVISMQEDMQRALGTKVKIKHKNKKGKIEIDYYSLEDLSRICDLFKVDVY